MKFKLYMHCLYKIIVLYLFISVHSSVSFVKIIEQFKHTLFAKQLVILKDSTKAKKYSWKNLTFKEEWAGPDLLTMYCKFISAEVFFAS